MGAAPSPRSRSPVDSQIKQGVAPDVHRAGDTYRDFVGASIALDIVADVRA
jgi:hypothetical protein